MEGIIKFNIDWEKKQLEYNDKILELDKLRTELHKLKLVGIYPDGLGYGNVSVREGNGFLITGSQTGKPEILGENGYSFVSSWDISKNYLKCEGLLKASSESLTHAAVYEIDKNIKCVIHIHSKDLWEKYIDKLPTSDKNAEYGTVLMANSIKEIIKAGNKIVVMGGHYEGILVCGELVSQAQSELKSIL